MFPVQVTEEGVIIPKAYLWDADKVEVIVGPEYIIVKPCSRSEQSVPPRTASEGRFSFIGIGETRTPTASTEVETILEREADRRKGWSLRDNRAV